MIGGWVKGHRKRFDNPLFTRPYCRGYAWDWLCAAACIEPTKFDIKGKTVTVKRGQIAISMRRLAKEWGWSKSAVDRFITRLKTETMIGTETGTGVLIITICNYDQYQGYATKGGTAAGTAAGTTAGQQRDTKEEGEEGEDSSDTNVPGAGAPADPVKILFDSGIALLAGAGIPGKRARPILGKWRSRYGDEAVIAALGAAQREGAIDPVAFIERCLRNSTRSEPKQTEDGRVVYADAFGGGPVHR